MNGQVEGLEIGGEAIGLWNYREAHGIQVVLFDLCLSKSIVQQYTLNIDRIFIVFVFGQGARPRNKFKQQTERSVKFGGMGYIAISNLSDKYFADVASEFVIKLKVK